jgi:hypothetical protein
MTSHCSDGVKYRFSKLKSLVVLEGLTLGTMENVVSCGM